MVSNMLINDAEAATRIAGLEQTKAIIEEISAEDIRKFVPHLHSYFVTLGNVLDDLNFKVVVLCLDVVRLTIERLNGHIAVHEQIINIITAALLTFNASKINLSAIASLIAPLLTDPKRRVRLAAFENFAVLASLSSDRIEVLLKIVREVEHKQRSFGLLNAVTVILVSILVCYQV
uniref:Adaptin_N domain-containing protein n=1 Tax=Ascaris lumbricoides TaxID=6252 RepID=A0A0M3IUU9_ASCLU